jgi:hypothetical protein
MYFIASLNVICDYAANYNGNISAYFNTSSVEFQQLPNRHWCTTFCSALLQKWYSLIHTNISGRNNASILF